MRSDRSWHLVWIEFSFETGLSILSTTLAVLDWNARPSANARVAAASSPMRSIAPVRLDSHLEFYHRYRYRQTLHATHVYRTEL